MPEQVLQSANGGKALLQSFEDDGKVGNDEKQKIGTLFACWMKELNSSIAEIAKHQTVVDENQSKLLDKLSALTGKTLQSHGKRNFIKSAMAFEYTRIHAKLIEKGSSIRSYLQKAESGNLQNHLKLNKLPPSNPEFSTSLRDEIKGKVAEWETEIRAVIKNNLQMQLQWMQSTELLVRKEFMRLYRKNALKAKTHEERLQVIEEFKIICQKKTAAKEKATKKLNLSQASKPPKSKPIAKKRKMQFENRKMATKKHRKNN